VPSTAPVFPLFKMPYKKYTKKRSTALKDILKKSVARSASRALAYKAKKYLSAPKYGGYQKYGSRIYYGGSSNPRYRGEVRRDGITVPIQSGNGSARQAAVRQIPGAYIKCLLDPENNSPVCIPDLSCYPTVLFTMTEELTLALNSVGAGGIRVRWHGDPRYDIETAATTTDNIFTYTLDAGFRQRAAVIATYSHARIVAYSIRVDFLGNDTNNQGFITHCRFLGVNDRNPIPGSVADVRNFHDAYFGPLKDGLYVTYRPLDSSMFDMLQTDDDELDIRNCQWGGDVIHWSGAGGLTPPSVAIKITVHWEGIQLASGTTPAEQAQPSHVDANELNFTQANAGKYPTCLSSVQGKSTQWSFNVDQAGQTVLDAAVSAGISKGWYVHL